MYQRNRQMINFIIFLGMRSHGAGRIFDQLKIRTRLGVRAIFVVWPWKMVSVSVLYLFYRQIMKRSKHGLFVFPPKRTLIWRRHCSIDQSCCSMTSKRSIGWSLESSQARSFFAQSNRSVTVYLLLLFCSRVFISRSYEIGSNNLNRTKI